LDGEGVAKFSRICRTIRRKFRRNFGNISCAQNFNKTATLAVTDEVTRGPILQEPRVEDWQFQRPTGIWIHGFILFKNKNKLLGFIDGFWFDLF